MSQATLRQPLSPETLRTRLALVHAYLQANTNTNLPTTTATTTPPSTSNSNTQVTMISSRRRKSKRFSSLYTSRVPIDAWKSFIEKKVPFLAVPPEIHLRIFEFLHPVEAVCLSVVNKYIYSLAPPFDYRLDLGSPGSPYPLPRPTGCRHCLPVRFYPAHCELHFHLRPIVPPHLAFCASCARFTACQDGQVSDRAEYCGHCGISYRKIYAEGRRMIDVERPGETQRRLRKWYNETTSSDQRCSLDLIRMGEL